MIDETTLVARHAEVPGGYRCLTLEAPRIAAEACPGQFVHLKIPGLEDRMLRRPFSIHRAEHGRVVLLYKPVGQGTRRMTELAAGGVVKLAGPLGRGFPLDIGDAFPVLVAGGYGMAALYLLAQRLPRPGVIIAGGADKDDILCRDEIAALNWPLRAATENGSLGFKGLVTALLDEWIQSTDWSKHPRPVFFACGPYGMLRAVACLTAQHQWRTWVSLERHMGCGVGACLACVHKIRGDDGTIRWGRVCREGPVFDSREVVWDE